MKYVITENQKEKILLKIFNELFDGAELKSGDETDDRWFGFYDTNNNFLVGYTKDDPEEWYFDGTVFRVYWELLDIDVKFFVDSLKKYIFDKYGVKIKNLM